MDKMSYPIHENGLWRSNQMIPPMVCEGNFW